MPPREHVSRILIGMLLANAVALFTPELAGRVVVLGAVAIALAWIGIDHWLLEPLRVADREEELRRYAIERDPNSPRTARGFPLCDEKSFTRVYPYGCPDPEVTTF